MELHSDSIWTADPRFKHKTLSEPKQEVPSSPLPTPWSLLWTGATHASVASPPTSIQRDPRARRAHYRKATHSSHHHDLFERCERGMSNSAAEREERLAIPFPSPLLKWLPYLRKLTWSQKGHSLKKAFFSHSSPFPPLPWRIWLKYSFIILRIIILPRTINNKKRRRLFSLFNQN